MAEAVGNVTDSVDVTNGTDDGQLDILVLYGPANPYFNLIHYSALSSLGLSIVISLYTVIYLLRTGNRNIFQRKMGERFVLYLSAADLLFSVIHAVDHMYSILQIQSGFEEFCVFAGFLLETFSNAQSILVLITAVSAFVTVAFNKRITFGKYDWMLLLTTIGIPVTLSSVMAGLDWLGPSGFWCLGDLRKNTGPVVYTIFSSFIIATFTANLICYIGVWGVIVTTAKQINSFKDRDSGSTEGGSYNKTARILVLFVLAYMAQWWPLVVYSIWSYFAVPHIAIVETVVLFANMGGLFNYIAYTFVRKRQNTNETKTSTTSTGNSSTSISIS